METKENRVDALINTIEEQLECLEDNDQVTELQEKIRLLTADLEYTKTQEKFYRELWEKELNIAKNLTAALKHTTAVLTVQ